MKFDEFLGNEKVKQQLTCFAEAGNIPHAIILEGEAGLGKRTLARELALNLFCRSEEERPCRKCPQCSKVLKGVHPDIYEYSASGAARSFHVDVVREVKEDAFMQPNEADYKIYILGNCQSMSESAQNALLKVLEEPPSYVIFILTVNNKSALLETVLSRSVVISIEGVKGKEAAEYVCSKVEGAEYEEALAAVESNNGNIGKAIESLADGKLAKITALSNEIARSVVSESEYELLIKCSAFERDKETLISTVSLLKSVFRDALVGGNDLMSGQKEAAELVASRLSKKKILNLISACGKCLELADKNANNSILITKICYELRRAVGR